MSNKKKQNTYKQNTKQGSLHSNNSNSSNNNHSNNETQSCHMEVRKVIYIYIYIHLIIMQNTGPSEALLPLPLQAPVTSMK
jgi:hypothetical protein